MNSNCYLFLLRWTGSLPDNKASIAMSLKKFFTGFVRGDSLEAPFMNFIKVDSMSHNIGGFGGGGAKDYSDIAKLGRNIWNHDESQATEATNWSGTEYDFNYDTGLRSIQNEHARPGNAANDAWRWSGEPPMTEPGGMHGSLPVQNHLSFSKRVDSATPQLAYGCTTQEQYKVALFYYRRKVALNVASVQFPYFLVGLENVIIRDWSLNDDSETVKLSYDRICWGAVSQFADTPVPQGISTRIFDRTTGAGGLASKSALTGFVAGLTLVIYGVAWAAIAAAEAAKRGGYENKVDV